MFYVLLFSLAVPPESRQPDINCLWYKKKCPQKSAVSFGTSGLQLNLYTQPQFSSSDKEGPGVGGSTIHQSPRPFPHPCIY